MKTTGLQLSLAFLLLFFLSPCNSYGLEGCVRDYYNETRVWCFHRNIKNISSVVDKIPHDIIIINLSRNKINILPPDVFSKLGRLQKLTLDRNNISFLRNAQFRGLGQLLFLNLSCNHLTKIKPEAFEGLSQLRDLALHKNQLGEIQPKFFKFLPQIRYVQLSLNKLQYVDGNLYNSSTLSNLDLSFNNISWLNLSGFPSLTSLDLSFNPLLHLALQVTPGYPLLRKVSVLGMNPEILLGLSSQLKRALRQVSLTVSSQWPNLTVCGILRHISNVKEVYVNLQNYEFKRNTSLLIGCPKIKFLYLRNASLGDLSKSQLVQDGNWITDLSLTNCGLQHISSTTFHGLEQLRSLTLQNNDDLEIDALSFLALSRLKTLTVFSSGVKKPKKEWFQELEDLKILSMSRNKITELISRGFSSLSQLQQLSLEANALKIITKDHFYNLTSLRQLNLNLNIISYIEKGAFKDLKNLTHLDLGGNRIHTLNSHILHGLRKLKILKLYNNYLHFEDWESPFVALSSLEMIDLRYQGPLTTGLGNLGEHFFKGLELLKCLSIGYTILTTFHPNVFAQLVNLHTLYIGSVSMTNANLTFLFRNLVSLINLSLTKLDLDSLPSNLLPPRNTLKYLKVQYNHFHVLDESLQRNLPMLQYLDVIGNPLSCNCQNAWFKNWSLLNTDVQVAFVYDLRCDNELSSPHLWQFDDKACSYDLISFTLFLSTALLDMVLLLLGLIWQKSRSTIHYLLLLIRSRLFGKKRAAQKAYTYDAFISYSSKDDAWVMGELVPHLEGPQGEGFRLCLHHRDFHPGTAIMENIEKAIYSSRHTLCVVSHDFLRSEWCTLEFQLASLRLVYDQSDVLLLVFLEEIPNHRLSAYTRLRKMVCRNTYLLWPEDLMEREGFWVRLRNALRSGAEDGEDQDFTNLFA